MKISIGIIKRIIQLVILCVFAPNLALGLEVNADYKQSHIQVHVQDVRPCASLDGVDVVDPIMNSLRNIEERTDRKLNVLLTPHKRIKDLDMKKADLIVTFDGDRLHDVEEVASLFDFDVAVIVRADNNFDEIKQNQQASIAVIRGTHMGVEAVNHNVHYIEVKTYEQGLQLLQKKRVDAVMGIKEELSMAAASLNQKDKSLVGETHIVDVVSAKIYVPNEFKAKPYVSDVRKAVEAMKHDGVLAHSSLSRASH